MKTHTTRQQTIQALEATRKYRVCAYMGDFCDCKYGIGPEVEVALGKRFAHGHSFGEKTGCPEMRTALSILNNMTDAEWARIEQRMTRNAARAFKKHSRTKAGK